MTIQDDKHQKKEKNTKICQQNKFQHNITSVTVHNANIQSVLTLTVLNFLRKRPKVKKISTG